MSADAGRRVIACGALAFDVRAIARRRGWEVDVRPGPTRCCTTARRRSRAAVAERCADGHDVVAVAYGDCGTDGALDAVLGGCRACAATHCYDMLRRATRWREALAEEPGTYFLTDFLARTFEHTVVRELGLDRWPELRDDVLRATTRACCGSPSARRRPPARCAEAAAQRLGLPLEVRAVGTAGLERELEQLVGTEGDRA